MAVRTESRSDANPGAPVALAGVRAQPLLPAESALQVDGHRVGRFKAPRLGVVAQARRMKAPLLDV